MFGVTRNGILTGRRPCVGQANASANLPTLLGKFHDPVSAWRYSAADSRSGGAMMTRPFGVGLNLERLDDCRLSPSSANARHAAEATRPRTPTSPASVSLFVIEVPDRQIQRGTGVLVDRRREIAPRSDISRTQHLPRGRLDRRVNAVSPERVMRIPRRPIVVCKQVHVDRSVISLANRDAYQRLRPEMPNDWERVFRRSSTACSPHAAHNRRSSAVRACAMASVDVTCRQLRVEDCPVILPVLDTGNGFAIKQLRSDDVPFADSVNLKWLHATQPPAGNAPTRGTGRLG